MTMEIVGVEGFVKFILFLMLMVYIAGGGEQHERPRKYPDEYYDEYPDKPRRRTGR